MKFLIGSERCSHFGIDFFVRHSARSTCRSRGGKVVKHRCALSRCRTECIVCGQYFF